MPEQEVIESEPKPVLVYRKDYVTLSEDNISEVEQFIGAKLEGDERGVWYGFPNDGKSRRAMVGDRLMLDGERIIVWPSRNFKATYEIGK